MTAFYWIVVAVTVSLIVARTCLWVYVRRQAISDNRPSSSAQNWRLALCANGLHWSGTIDGGGMGDCWRCDVCETDKYPEVFPGIILHPRKQWEPKK